MKVKEILQAKGASVYCVPATATMRDAVEMLAEKNVGALVVSGADGAPVGVLSERDVVRQLRTDGEAALGAAVSACMTAEPFTCGEEATCDELMSQMTTRRIRHIPVVERGRMVGLVSIGDVVKRKIDEAEQEAAALKSYIAST
ncbi:MAG: CBS domain-containing protein [Parvularculaceae bacterium]